MSRGEGGAADDDLHAQLRRRTRDAHRRLERAPLLRGLLRPGLRPGDYRALLERFARAYAGIEAALATDDAACQPFRYRARLPALRQDLAALRAEAPPAAALPASAASVAGFGLGLRYALEGQSQGAKVITEVLERTLPELRARAFWDMQRAAGADWERFAAYLHAIPADDARVEPALRGADAAFGIFVELFEAAAR